MKFNYKKKSGQSLIEILIALAIGAILIGASAIGISFITRSTTANENLQIASSLAREQTEKLRAWLNADWQNIYSLEKGSSTKYFIIPSSTSFVAIKGEEGIESGDTSGLVARWGFDEATGSIAYDYSGNQNNGSITGDLSWLLGTNNCKLSGCFSYGTNNSIVVPDSATIDPLSGWTLMAWVKRNGVGVEDPIVEKYDGIAGGNFYLKINSQNKLDGGVAEGASLQSCGTASSTILSEIWYHVATTFDNSGNILACYVNGTLDSINNSASLNPTDSSVTLKIGCEGDCSTTKFSGMIDDVRIYNRALSASEINTFYRGKFFIRSFFVENVCRSTDSTNEIQSDCSGGAKYTDPSTQKVTTLVKWPVVQLFGQVQLVNFFTRWKNEIFHQQNWAGGAGQDDPVTIPNSQFSSSSRINFSSSGGIFAE